MFSKILLVAALTVGAAACVGDVPDNDGTPGTNPNPNPTGENSTGAQLAKKSYDDNVFSIVSASCGGCHGAGLAAPQNPAFVGASPDLGYNQIVGFSQLIGTWTNESAGVYTVPAIAAHSGVAPYTQPQRDAIAAWLSLEASARSGSGGPTTPGEETPGAASSRLTKAFQDCMALTDFTATNFGNQMANQQSGEGPCEVCHQNAQGGLIANRITLPEGGMFTTLKTNAYFLATYFAVNVITKPYKVDFNEAAFLRVNSRKFPHQNHPTFQVTGGNAQGLTAAKAFLTATLGRLDANGNCPTPQQ